MNVAFCCNDNFAIPVLVSLVSLFENNKETLINVYIVTKGLSVNNVKKFDSLSKEYNCTIRIFVIDANLFQNLVLTHERWPIEIYFRYLLPEIIDDDKVLYLDGDVLVRHNLMDIWNADLNGVACGIVEDENGDDVCRHNRLGIQMPYFNSGVILFNLQYWRENNILQKLTDYISKNPRKCILPDQDALNAVLEHSVLLLDYSFNFQQKWFDGSQYVQLQYEKLLKIKSIGLNPSIVHFCQEIKPWHKEYKCLFKDEYLYYAQKHKFVGFKQIHKHSLLYRIFDFGIRGLIRFRDIVVKS